jgi:hypothetical protein
MTADDLRAGVDAAWTAFRRAVVSADLDRVTSAGWRAKEMLAHVAFWLETVPPFVSGAFRGQPEAFSMTFPSGYVAGEGDWPAADVHNAREASWARDQAADAVLARADRAYDELRTFLATVTDEEVAAQAEYFASIGGHLDEHRTDELAGA